MDYKDFSADAVHFQLQCVPSCLPGLLASDTHTKLKLQTKLSIGAHLEFCPISPNPKSTGMLNE